MHALGFAATVALDEVVEGLHAVLFQERAEVHVAAHAKVAVILLLDGAHVGVIALVAKASILFALGPGKVRADAPFEDATAITDRIRKVNAGQLWYCRLWQAVLRFAA